MHTNRRLLSLATLALWLGCASVDDMPADTLPTPEEPGVQPTSVTPGTEPVIGEKSSALQALAGCDAVVESLRARALAEIRARVAQQRKSYESVTCRSYLDAGVAYSPGNVSASAPTKQASATAPPTSAGKAPAADNADNAGSSAPTQVSETNNQVAEVDEADMVKTDGRYMYVASQGVLHIVEAWPAATAHEIKRVNLGGTPLKLFVENGRAIVYVSSGAARGRACTYGYDCDFTGDGTSTRVIVLDVSNPAEPRRLREFALSGSLLAARRIGSSVHTVVSDSAFSVPGLRTVPAIASCPKKTPEELDAAYLALDNENVALIAKQDALALLPKISDSQAGSLLSECRGFYAAAVESGASFTSVLSFDMTRDQPATTTTVVSRPGAVYVSGESLYMAVREGGTTLYGSTVRAQASVETSLVHRFRVGADASLTRYEASGRVQGHVLNQFAMDEWQGHLRMATTSGWVPDPLTKSTISVLAQSGSALAVVGKIEGIAPTEDIRSVRFAGARGFIVTFKKTDPLFAFDLAVPSAPKLLGELKIPGFSTYMQLLDDTHLLTIGYDADDQGSFAYFQGVLLQIFDVSDPRAPTLAHKAVIGTRGSSSEALTNHLAFNYFAPKKLLALPMTICEGGASGSFGTNMTFSGLLLYDVDLTTGFRERGRVAHPSLATGYDNRACSNWWTQASSIVKRSVFMDDFVYSVAEDVVRVQALGALGSDLASVSLKTASCVTQGGTYAHGQVMSIDESCNECVCNDGQIVCGTAKCSIIR